MEWQWSLVLIWSITIFFSSYALFRRRIKSVTGPLPPGPPGWPVFGHIFNLGTMPHRTVAGLAKDYGPVVWLKLGSVDTVAILTAKAATELFKKHDLIFAERTITETSRSHDYDKSSLALAPYGTYWRVLRKICTVEMLVNKRINDSENIRKRCINDMLQWIEKESKSVKEGTGVHVAKFVFLATFNLLGNLMLSRDLADPESKTGLEFFDAMRGGMEWGGVPNISDIYPALKRFDFQGLRKKMDRDLGKALEIASVFIRERIRERGNVETGGERHKDFLEILLDYEGSGKDEPEKMSEHDITIFIVVIFLSCYCCI